MLPAKRKVVGQPFRFPETAILLAENAVVEFILLVRVAINEFDHIGGWEGLEEFFLFFESDVVTLNDRFNKSILNRNQVLAESRSEILDPFTLNLLGVLLGLTESLALFLGILFQTVPSSVIQFLQAILGIKGNTAFRMIGDLVGERLIPFVLGTKKRNDLFQFGFRELADFGGFQLLDVLDVFDHGRSVLPNGFEVNNKIK